MMVKLRELCWYSRNKGRYPEKMFFFGHCPNNPSPQFGQLLQLFLDVKIQGLKANWGLKILYTIWYPVHKQPLKQFKVQIIGILEEKDPYYWPKMKFLNGAKKFGQGPRPPPRNAWKNIFYKIPSLMLILME